MGHSKHTVLAVDDDELLRNLMAAFLSKMGYSCTTATDGMDALEKIEADKIDAVVTDVKMPKMDGIDLTKAISKQYPGLPIMITTAFGEEYSIGTAISVGAREFIQKPFTYFEFTIRLKKMIYDAEFLRRKKINRNENKEIEKLKDELEHLLKDSRSAK